MVHGGFRSFLVVLGGSLWFLVVPHVFFVVFLGHFWRFFGILEEFCWLLAVLGGSMWFFVFLGGYWWFCLVFCGCWQFLVVHGVS